MTRVTLLCGGVGGAKLARGLYLTEVVDLTVVVNTGDDFEHLGLMVCPDVDTVLYTLSGRANRAQGWGREGETWSFLEALRSLGGEDWFQLGDGDLALHVLRTAKLRAGESLSAVTRHVAEAWGIRAKVLPMSDQPLRTYVHTDEGVLPFQRYFVERRCTPRVQRIAFEGVASAAPGVTEALLEADVVVIAPSNPYLSIDPILAVPEIADALRARPALAVSPLVGGKAVKGPTDKLMRELGIEVGNDAIARHYDGLIHGLMIHEGDAAPRTGVAVRATNTLMRDDADRQRVARAVLAFGRA